MTQASIKSESELNWKLRTDTDLGGSSDRAPLISRLASAFFQYLSVLVIGLSLALAIMWLFAHQTMQTYLLGWAQIWLTLVASVSIFWSSHSVKLRWREAESFRKQAEVHVAELMQEIQSRERKTQAELERAEVELKRAEAELKKVESELDILLREEFATRTIRAVTRTSARESVHTRTSAQEQARLGTGRRIRRERRTEQSEGVESAIVGSIAR